MMMPMSPVLKAVDKASKTLERKRGEGRRIHNAQFMMTKQDPLPSLDKHTAMTLCLVSIS